MILAIDSRAPETVEQERKGRIVAALRTRRPVNTSVAALSGCGCSEPAAAPCGCSGGEDILPMLLRYGAIAAAGFLAVRFLKGRV